MNSADDHHAQVSDWRDDERDDLTTTPLERHFGAVRPLAGGDAFLLLPSDA